MKFHLAKPLFFLLLVSLLPSPLWTQTSMDSWFQRRKSSEDLVLLRNRDEKIPILQLPADTLVVVSLGTDLMSTFQEHLRFYTDITRISIDYEDENGPIALSRVLRRYEHVIVAWHNQDAWQAQPEVTRDRWRAAVQDDIDAYRRAIVVADGDASSLLHFPGMSGADHLLLTRGNTSMHEALAAQVIMGAEPCYGRLTEDVSSFFLAGNGIRINGGYRLRYSFPEAVGWDGEDFRRRMDSVVQMGIRDGAFPGCQILVAKEGQVIFHQAYGHHTYDETIAVSDLDLYDLASVTKVMGPLPPLMKLVDEAKIQLDAPLSAYWPDFATTDKRSITVREALAHQAGFIPYIRFYDQTMRPNGKFRWRTVKPDSSEVYAQRIFRRMYLHQRWEQKIYQGVRDTALTPDPEYLYSGLPFLLFPEIIHSITALDYDQYLREEFLIPLGASRVQYNPWRSTGLESIVPTEYDSTFRKSLVHGYVHDENAAMMGGVSGNAGLFGNTHDLAKILQMLLNEGQYGGQRFLSQEVVREFTSYQFEGNRRGLGFDKPPRKASETSYISLRAGEDSFGHSGFTGTFFWADPEEELMLIFLSNRVYPTRHNRQLYEAGIREAIHELCYTARQANWSQD